MPSHSLSRPAIIYPESFFIATRNYTALHINFLRTLRNLPLLSILRIYLGEYFPLITDFKHISSITLLIAFIIKLLYIYMYIYMPKYTFSPTWKKQALQTVSSFGILINTLHCDAPREVLNFTHRHVQSCRLSRFREFWFHFFYLRSPSEGDKFVAFSTIFFKAFEGRLKAFTREVPPRG